MNARIDAAELLKGTTPGPWFVTDDRRTIYATMLDGWYNGKQINVNRIWFHVYADRRVDETEVQTTVALLHAAPALATRVVELENALRELERGARELTQAVRNELPDLSVPLTCAMRASDVARAVLDQESP